jgi:hypothetical protein
MPNKLPMKAVAALTQTGNRIIGRIANVFCINLLAQVWGMIAPSVLGASIGIESLRPTTNVEMPNDPSSFRLDSRPQ